MANDSIRYVGNPDFHDGYVREVSRSDNTVDVAVEGSSGVRYLVRFHGVRSWESKQPEGMMLYGLAERRTEEESLHRYEFVNWHVDEPEKKESKSRLQIVAAGVDVVTVNA